MDDCKPLPAPGPAPHRTPCPLPRRWAEWERCGRPASRIIENKHSNRYRNTTHLQDECSYRRADPARRFNVGRVLVLSSPHGGSLRTSTRTEIGRCTGVTLIVDTYTDARRRRRTSKAGRVLVLNKPWRRMRRRRRTFKVGRVLVLNNPPLPGLWAPALCEPPPSRPTSRPTHPPSPLPPPAPDLLLLLDSQATAPGERSPCEPAASCTPPDVSP